MNRQRSLFGLLRPAALCTIVLSLSGCATCGREPVECGIALAGGAAIVGFGAAEWHSTSVHDGDPRWRRPRGGRPEPRITVSVPLP